MWAPARNRPLAGWILAGEICCGLGCALNIVVAFAFFGYARPLDVEANVQLAVSSLPWWAAVGSVLAGLLLWGGAAWLVVAYVLRSRLERRAATGRSLR